MALLQAPDGDRALLRHQLPDLGRPAQRDAVALQDLDHVGIRHLAAQSYHCATLAADVSGQDAGIIEDADLDAAHGQSSPYPAHSSNWMRARMHSNCRVRSSTF